MKQFITLLMTVALFGSASAQSPTTEEAKRVILGKPKNNGNDYPTTNESKDIILGRDDRRVYDERGNRYPGNRTYDSRQGRVNEVNREYDRKVQSIRNNPHLSSYEKERIIRGLNYERQKAINDINKDYKHQDKGRYAKNKKYKSNPGKHKGWTKGKGNPHRDRDDNDDDD